MTRNSAKSQSSPRAKTRPAGRTGRSADGRAGSASGGNGRRPKAAARTSSTAAKAVPKERLAEVVARRIEEDIAERGWPVGEILGSEADLIERHDVSRAVLREAVRIVEHHNVARMRRGPGGGLIVMEPDPRAIENATALYLRYVGVDRESLLEARGALELAAVTAAAERIDEEGIVRLREALAREEELGETGIEQARAHELHVVIADLTGNPAMHLFIEVLTRLEEEMSVAKRRKTPSPVSLTQAFEDSHRAHVAIVDAITSGDAALAQHRMRRHLDAVREFEY